MVGMAAAAEEGKEVRRGRGRGREDRGWYERL